MFQKPTVADLREAAARLGMHPSDAIDRGRRDHFGPPPTPMRRLTPLRTSFRRQITAPGSSTGPLRRRIRMAPGTSKRAIRETRRQVGGPACRARGQCPPRRRADDDRRARSSTATCRRSTPRSSRASSMPAARSPARPCANTSACRRQPYELDRTGAQSAQARLFRGRLVVGQRRAGRCGRRRYGDRRRSGRLDPHPGEPLRHRRPRSRPSASFPIPASGCSRSRSIPAGRLLPTSPTTRCCSEVFAGPYGFDLRQRGVRSAATPRRSTAASRVYALPSVRKASVIPMPSATWTPRCARRRGASRRWARPSRRSGPCIRARPFRSGRRFAATRPVSRSLEMNGAGLGHEGLYVTEPDRARDGRAHADDFADTLKIASLLAGTRSTVTAATTTPKAQNLRRRLRASYDAVLATTTYSCCLPCR